jgi:DNA-binding NtrC family response regulator
MPTNYQQFYSGSAGKSLTILVADDGPESRLQLQQWLESSGHNVTCVGSGNDAMRLLRDRTFDVIMTEVIMANGDGLEVILDVKKRQPEARIIAMSAGGRYLPAVECLRVAKGMGAHEVLFKPVDRTALMAALEHFSAVAAPKVA